MNTAREWTPVKMLINWNLLFSVPFFINEED